MTKGQQVWTRFFLPVFVLKKHLWIFLFQGTYWFMLCNLLKACDVMNHLSDSLIDKPINLQCCSLLHQLCLVNPHFKSCFLGEFILYSHNDPQTVWTNTGTDTSLSCLLFTLCPSNQRLFLCHYS